MTLAPQQLPELNFDILDRELDRVKTRVFLGKNASFLGSLMCSLNFMWDKKIPTAATNGISIMWNPWYFHYLSARGRDSILVHELKHVALLHPLRRGSRHPGIWNAACDTVLDNQMDLDGYLVDETLYPLELFPEGGKPFTDHVTYGDMSAEEIYDLMMQKMPPPPPPTPCSPNGGGGPPGIPVPGSGKQQGIGLDLIEPAPGDKTINHQVLNNVVAAMHAAKMAGNAPGDVEVVLNQFLAPKVAWEIVLLNFFNELYNQDYSWARPNRRYQEMYLPSLRDDDEGLDHIAYFLDVSGSISDKDIIRFHSEFKYVKDRFEPEKMTMVQFDTKIQKEEVFLKDDPFEETHVIGRGGTSLACVRDWIIRNKPTAVVIFSDLCVTPMVPLAPSEMVPIIWIGLNADKSHKVPHGTVVHIRE